MSKIALKIWENTINAAVNKYYLQVKATLLKAASAISVTFMTAHFDKFSVFDATSATN